MPVNINEIEEQTTPETNSHAVRAELEYDDTET